MNLEERHQYIKSLQEEYFAAIEVQTPPGIKQQPIFDLNNKGEITFRLTKEMVADWKLGEWLDRYRQEATHAIGGVRGPQNVLYPWDVRFPINQLGVAVATIGKALALREANPGKELHKIAGGEVRYNTDHYVGLISRLQAALGIFTHQPKGIHLTTIWMTSFLIFMNDYAGGEYVTASHSVSSKTATKDLDNEGAQFSAEVSLGFVDKMAQIVEQAKIRPEGYVITLASKDNPKIIQDFDGFDLYAEHLRRVVATPANLDLIKQAATAGMRLMFETVGGCMYQNLVPLFDRLGMPPLFDWHNSEEDPFFHGVGKVWRPNLDTGKPEFFDLSCDASLPEVQVTMGYEEVLRDKPVGYTILITDPDGDRLVMAQVERAERREFLEKIGIDFLVIDQEKIIVFYHPAYTFLLIMDFHMRQLKAAGQWDKHSRIMIATTPSPRSWDEWAKACGVAVLTTPVGFKEIQQVMKKVEKQLRHQPTSEVRLTNIWGKEVSLGLDPRLVFAGEESGGMIIGPEDLVVSRGGRQALAMREKSAGEASIVAAALAARLYLQKKLLSEHLENIFNEYNIAYRSYVRSDITYYNESEPDPIKMLQARTAGELTRDRIDLYYVGLALARREGLVDVVQVQAILHEALPGLDFSNLEDILFTGDATYLKWLDMFVQIRKSKNDAKLRGYANGSEKGRCQHYLKELLNYSGEVTPLYDKLISGSYRETVYHQQDKIYYEYLNKDL
ncbi:MAG: hypothetical protein HY973_01685 [Candidatus Kerfeldbacteria bacterium]|nr:hypothetical protein [Candidatus Kerfeldbacteria bacterium]